MNSRVSLAHRCVTIFLTFGILPGLNDFWQWFMQWGEAGARFRQP
jgi:hypothetical protein